MPPMMRLTIFVNHITLKHPSYPGFRHYCLTIFVNHITLKLFVIFVQVMLSLTIFVNHITLKPQFRIDS